MATTRARRPLTYRKWQADEEQEATATNSALFRYRLVWGNGKDAGRAAYRGDIRPGDIILNYRGQWLRVLALTPTYDEQSAYDGTLAVEVA